MKFKPEFRTLAQKLFFSTVPLLVAILILTALFTIQMVSRSEKSLILSLTQELMLARITDFEEWLMKGQNHVLLLRDQWRPPQENPSFDGEMVLHVLDAFPFHVVFYADLLGNSINSLGSKEYVGDEDFFRQIVLEGKESCFFFQGSPSTPEDAMIVIAAAVQDSQGALQGIVGGIFPVSSVYPLITQITIRPGSYGWLLDAQGQVLVHPAREMLQGGNLFSGDRANDPSLQQMARDMEEGRGGIRVVQRADGVVQTLLYTPLSLVPRWFLGVSLENRELYANTRQVIMLIGTLFSTIAVVLITSSLVIGNIFVRPLHRLDKAIEAFGKGNLKQRVQVSGKDEIARIASRFNEMARSLEDSLEQNEGYAEELQAANEQLEANNLELERSNQEIQSLANDLQQIIFLTSRMARAARNKDEHFLHELLEMLLVMLPKADFGSISVIEGDKWRFVHAVGHDIQLLKSLDLQVSHMFWSDRPLVVENVMETDKNQKIPQETYEKLLRATQPTQTSLIARLTLGNERLGSIALDIREGSDARYNKEDSQIVDAFANVASAFIAMQKYMITQGKFQKDLLLSMIKILEIYDPYTRGHSENVAQLSSRLAEKLGWSKDEISRVYWTGLVHDIGKILVPPSILTKTGRLSEEEFEKIQQHPVWGAQVLQTSDELRDIVQAVRHHHEKWDGSGYPDGLVGEEIPIVSRLISVADAFDAMTSDRPYRKALPLEIAKQELMKYSGTQFDQDMVVVFLQVLEEGPESPK